MRIAYIILCHKNSNQINMMIEQLNDKNCDMYIHIDKKNYVIVNDIIKHDNMKIIDYDSSIDVSWGGVSMIEATLRLLSEVKKSDVKYDYVCLLSGQDLMINTKKEFYKKLKSRKNFIEIIDEKNIRYNRYKKLYEVPYPQWITKDKLLYKIVKRLYMIITGGFEHSFSIFKRKLPIDGKLYFGSQWWCLTYECCEYMLDYVGSNSDYLNYFKKTIIPDECFFQTLFMNSPYSDNYESNLTYVNWKNNRRSPEIFTMDDMDLLCECNKKYIFARKFDCNVQKRIFETILKKYK